MNEQLNPADIHPGDIMVGHGGLRYEMIEPLFDRSGPDICTSEEHDGRPLQVWRVHRLDHPSISDILCPHGLTKEKQE